MKKQIKYKFFTKNNGLSSGIYKSLNCGLKSKDDINKVKSNIALAASYISREKKKIIIPNLLHSNKCMIVNKIYKEYKCDGLVSQRDDVILGVTTADCLPIIFYDSKSMIIGICHAGWKGLLRGILQNTINKMLYLGSRKKNIYSVIGPCIRKKSYEVSESFISELPTKYKVFSSKICGKYYYDLPALAVFIISKCGVSNINDIKRNTFMSRNYFSYRESKKKKYPDYGRNVNLISIN